MAHAAPDFDTQVMLTHVRDPRINRDDVTISVVTSYSRLNNIKLDSRMQIAIIFISSKAGLVISLLYLRTA